MGWEMKGCVASAVESWVVGVESELGPRWMCERISEALKERLE